MSFRFACALAVILGSAIGSSPAFAAAADPGQKKQEERKKENPPAAEPQKESAGPRRAPATAEYVLQPFDFIKVEVFKEPQLDRQVRIDQDSSVTLPLIQKIDLKGKTVGQAQELIRALYDKDYLVNPQINVTVLEYSKRMVNVLGAVATQGAILIPPDRSLNVIDAISQSGGFTRFGNRKKVSVTRTLEDGRTQKFEFNVDEIERSSSSEGWVLRPGDVVFVPENIL